MVVALVEAGIHLYAFIVGHAVPIWFSVPAATPAQAREISPTAEVARPIRLACG